MGVLRSQSGNRQVVLSAVHVVGRLQSCALLLVSDFVSTAHAMIRWDGHSWSVRDLGSRNGTYVNESAVPTGDAVPLRPGARIAFGGPAETWILDSANGPSPAVIPVDGGPPIFLTQPITGLPSAEEPVASIYLDGEAWVLESEDARIVLHAGALFTVGDRTFRFECPSGPSETATSAADQCDLHQSTLLLNVSRNEEHVALALRTQARSKSLGERGCFYLLLVLARQRLRTPVVEGDEHGWVAIEDLLRMIPDYSSSVHLNVEIFRLRRLIAQAGIRDAGRIIERRRGSIRIGTDRVDIRGEAPGD